MGDRNKKSKSRVYMDRKSKETGRLSSHVYRCLFNRSLMTGFRSTIMLRKPAFNQHFQPIGASADLCLLMEGESHVDCVDVGICQTVSCFFIQPRRLNKELNMYTLLQSSPLYEKNILNRTYFAFFSPTESFMQTICTVLFILKNRSLFLGKCCQENKTSGMASDKIFKSMAAISHLLCYRIKIYSFIQGKHIFKT